MSTKKNKGGRPFLGAGLEGKELQDYIYKTKIYKKIPIGFTHKEFDKLIKLHQIVSKEVKLNRSSFIKKMIFEKDISQVLLQNNNTLLIKELNKVGVNINQITKKINSYAEIRITVSSQLRNIEKELSKITSIISSLL